MPHKPTTQALAVRSILQKARHSIICRAKNMAQRLSNDWFAQQSTNRSLPPSECPLSQSFSLSQECRVLQQDQALLDILDDVLAGKVNTPENLKKAGLDHATSIHHDFKLDHDKNTIFFRHHSKRGYF